MIVEYLIIFLSFISFLVLYKTFSSFLYCAQRDLYPEVHVHTGATHHVSWKNNETYSCHIQKIIPPIHFIHSYSLPSFITPHLLHPHQLQGHIPSLAAVHTH